MGQRSILIVETSPGPLQTVANNLSEAGCVVVSASTIREGLHKALDTKPDIVVLASTNRDEDILDLCQSLLRHFPGQTTPAILIAPIAASESKEEDYHANSYLAESLALDLLAQSVRTLTFRTKDTDDGTGVVECHGIRVDSRFSVTEVDGKTLDLTPTEFRILRTLISRPGHVFDRQQLEDAIGVVTRDKEDLAEKDNAQARTRRIDVHVKSIRQKLGQKSVLIETVRGIGYRFREAAWNISLSK